MIGLRDQNLELMLLFYGLGNILQFTILDHFNLQSVFAFNLVLVVDFIQDIHWYLYSCS